METASLSNDQTEPGRKILPAPQLADTSREEVHESNGTETSSETGFAELSSELPTDPYNLISWAAAALAGQADLAVDVTHPSVGYRPIPAQEILRHMRKATVSSISHKRYGKKAMLALHWEDDDVFAAEDSEKMMLLTRDVFGFEVQDFKIPLKNPMSFLTGAISNFIGHHDESEVENPPSLLLFHYAGHGCIKNKHDLYIGGTKQNQARVAFTSVLGKMLKCRGDVLIILDCCHAAAALRGEHERTVELVVASGEREYTYSKELSFTNFFDMAARYLAKRGPFTMNCLLRALHKTKSDTSEIDSTNLSHGSDSTTSQTPIFVDKKGRPYHTVPHLQPLLGSKPITLEPVSNSSTGNSNLTGTSQTDRNVYVAVVFHVVENPSTQELQDLVAAMESFSVRPGFHAKVLCQLKSSSTLLLVAVPSLIYDCLISDPAYIYVGVISADNPSALVPRESDAPLTNILPVPVRRPEGCHKRLKDLWNNALTDYLGIEKLDQSLIQILTAAIEVDRVGLQSETWQPCLPSADIAMLLGKLGTENSFRDFTKDVFLCDMEQFLRLLAASLRLYRFHGKSLYHDSHDLLYKKLEKNIQQIQKDVQDDEIVERGNIAFLLQHCRFLLVSIESSHCLARSTAREFVRGLGGDSTAIAKRYDEIIMRQRYDEIMQCAERQRIRPGWHARFVQMDDLCSATFMHWIGMRNLDGDARDSAPFEDENIASMVLYDCLEDHFRQMEQPPTTNRPLLSKLTKPFQGSSVDDQVVDYLLYGVLDLMYQVSFRIPKAFRGKYFEQVFKGIRQVLEKAQPSSSLLYKALDLWNHINAIGEVDKTTYGGMSDRDHICRWLKSRNINLAGHAARSAQLVLHTSSALIISSRRSKRISQQMASLQQIEISIVHESTSNLKQTDNHPPASELSTSIYSQRGSETLRSKAAGLRPLK